MDKFTIHYELKGRMSLEDFWTVIGYCSQKEHLDEMITHNKENWKYLSWDSYRAAPRLK